MQNGTKQHQGFTFNELHDKLDKANKEIFNLKIRIHFLEEKQGLMEEPDDKENVYRINLDLRVANQCLQQEVAEKDEQIKEAVRVIEQLEEQSLQERDNLKDHYERECQQLKIEVEDLKKQKNDEKESDTVRESLLGEAFGSMILDPSSENNANEELKEKLACLDTDLQIERDHNNDLKLLLEQQEEKVATLEKDFNYKEEQLQQTLAVRDEEMQAMANQINTDKERVELLQQEVDALHEQYAAAYEQNEALKNQLEMEQKSAQVLSERYENEISQLNQELASMKNVLEEESSTTKDQETYLNMKLTEIANLHKEVSSLNDLVKEKDEELVKVKTGLNAVSVVLEETNANLIQQGKELNKKNLMYDRLVTEYELAKSKVRKYRSERKNSSQCSQVLLDQPDATKAASYYIKQGADKALTKAKDVYNSHLKKMDQNYESIMMLMKTRLEELARCLEQILNHGLLDISESVRDALQASLNESRRLSKSFALDASMNMSLDQGLSKPQVPYVEVTLEDLELELNEDNMLNEIKEEYEEKMSKIKIEYEHCVQLLETELETLKAQIETSSHDQKKLDEAVEKVKFLEAERTDLRIKCTNLKDKLKIIEEENFKLKDKTKLNKLTQELKEVQDKNKFADSEMADLRKQLAEALEKIRLYNERQEKLDKTLRHQLAKTHTVLKRTKNAMDNIEANKENKMF